jgi:hypothetical protein
VVFWGAVIGFFYIFYFCWVCVLGIFKMAKKLIYLIKKINIQIELFFGGFEPTTEHFSSFKQSVANHCMTLTNKQKIWTQGNLIPQNRTENSKNGGISNPIS